MGEGKLWCVFFECYFAAAAASVCSNDWRQETAVNDIDMFLESFDMEGQT